MKVLILAVMATVTIQAATPCTKAGDICKLKSTGVKMQSVDWVPTAPDLPSWEEAKKAIKAGDDAGLAEMVRAGRLFLTAAGDGLRVLDYSFLQSRTEARMTTGKYRGMRVYTSNQWVVP